MIVFIINNTMAEYILFNLGILLMNLSNYFTFSAFVFIIFQLFMFSILHGSPN